MHDGLLKEKELVDLTDRTDDKLNKKDLATN